MEGLQQAQAGATLDTGVSATDSLGATATPNAGATNEPSQALQPNAQTPAQQAPSTEPQVEPFFSADNLAPELQSVYKSMQAAYTQKTQDIANMRRELQTQTEANRWVSDLDAISQTDPQRAAQFLISMAQELAGGNVQQFLQPQQQTQPFEQDIDMSQLSPEGQYLYQMNKQLAQQNQQLLQQMQQFGNRFRDMDLDAETKAQQEAATKQQQQVESFVDKHFPNVPPHDREMAVEAVKTAIQSKDPFALDNLLARLRQSTVNSTHQVLQAKAGASLPGATSPAGKSQTVQINSMEDAFALAKQQLGLS